MKNIDWLLRVGHWVEKKLISDPLLADAANEKHNEWNDDDSGGRREREVEISLNRQKSH